MYELNREWIVWWGSSRVKRMKILACVVVLALVACSQSRSAPSSEASSTINSGSRARETLYEIIAKDLSSSGRASFDVRIPKPVNEPEIRDMAEELHATVKNRDLVFVMFYLPQQEVGAGAYAAVQFRPEITVNMQGVTPSVLAEMNLESVEGDILGRWLDSSPMIGGVITITSDLRLEQQFKDGSKMTRDLRESKAGRGRRFDPVPASGHGDHWLLLPSGDLEIRDNEGLIATARVMR